MNKKIFLLILSLPISIFADCSTTDDKYKPLCDNLKKAGVDDEYISKVFQSEKIKIKMPVVVKMFSKKAIKTHTSNEKKANITLVSNIDTLVKHLDNYKEVYDFVEEKFQVNREIVAATLFKETRLGEIHPTYDAFIVFNTMISDITPNNERNLRLIKMATNNLSAVISTCYKNKIDVDHCKFDSSYAGAVGIPQFMPGNFHLLKSYTGGTPDIWKMEDAIVSCANFYHQNSNYRKLIDFNSVSAIEKTEAEWYEFSSHNPSSKFVSKNTDDCFTCSKPELTDISVLTKKILSYNNSSNYAIGIIRLAFEAHKLRTNAEPIKY